MTRWREALAKVCVFAALIEAAAASGCKTGTSGPRLDAVPAAATAPAAPAPPAKPAPGVACGAKTCAAGEVCCNPSCGICTPPDALCTMQICDEPAPRAAACTRDGDCRLEDDYCTGCDCRALGPEETVRACAGPGVRCVARPCERKAARCRGGRCVAE